MCSNRKFRQNKGIQKLCSLECCLELVRFRFNKVPWIAILDGKRGQQSGSFKTVNPFRIDINGLRHQKFNVV